MRVSHGQFDVCPKANGPITIPGTQKVKARKGGNSAPNINERRIEVQIRIRNVAQRSRIIIVSCVFSRLHTHRQKFFNFVDDKIFIKIQQPPAGSFTSIRPSIANKISRT